MTRSMKRHRRCAMGVKLNCVGGVLFCAVLSTQGARADNCQLSVSQPRIDYGLIRREETADSSTLALGTRALQLSVLCVEPSAMALRFLGAANGSGFRFGRQGRFRIHLRHAQVDGLTVEWAPQAGEHGGGQLLPGQVLVASAAGAAVKGKRLTAQVEIHVDLPSDALQVRHQTVLEGQGTFELISPAAPLSR